MRERAILMTRRTHYVMRGAASVLVIGLCTGLVAYYGGTPPAMTAAVAGPEELQYVPADALAVAYANIRAVMLSDFRQRIRDLEPEAEARQKFQELTGINLEEDIDYVVACAISDQDEPGGLVLLRGRFNQVQLETLARERGSTVEDHHGKRMLLLEQLRDEPRRAPVVAFLEPGLLALGDEASVRRAIDLPSSAQNVTTNGELMELLSHIDSDSTAWAVGRVDDPAAQALLPDEVANHIPAVTRIAVGGHINGGISGTLTAETRDDEAGQNLRNVLTGLMALAKMQAGSRPGLQPLLDSLQLSGVGTTVTLSFRLPPDVLELLLPDVERVAQ